MNILREYTRDVERARIMERDEELSALRAAKRGDEGAKERVVLSNIRLVISVALKYGGMGVPVMDLVQEGSIGLLKAIERFDQSKRTRFSTYASFWIRYYIQRAIDEKGSTVRLPVRRLRYLRRIAGEIVKQTMKNGEEPTMLAVGRALGWSGDRVNGLLDSVPNLVPMEFEISGETVEVPLSTMEDTSFNTALYSEMRMKCRNVLERLEPREAEVLSARFGLDGSPPMTLKEIGDEMGISAESVRQIELRASRKFRRCGESLKDYVSNS